MRRSRRILREHLSVAMQLILNNMPSTSTLNAVDFKGPLHARLILFNDTSRYPEEGLAIPAAPTARLSPWRDLQGEEGGQEGSVKPAHFIAGVVAFM